MRRSPSKKLNLLLPAAGLLFPLLLSAGTAHAQGTMLEDVPPEEQPEVETTTEGEAEAVDPTAPGIAPRGEETPGEFPPQETLTAEDASRYQEYERDVEGAPFQAHFELGSQGNYANNLDLRPVDNSTFRDRDETDDESTFAYTRVAGGFDWQIADDLETEVSFSHTGLWGGDSIGAANIFGGIFYVDRLFLDYTFVDTDVVEVSTKVGRQPFQIGGAREDFFFRDIIDGVTVDAGFGVAGKLRLLAVDFYAAGDRPDEINLASAVGDYDAADRVDDIENFEGDNNTFRFGGVYELTELIEGVEARAFGFYADVGGTTADGTGADRALGGQAGNFSDNDYSWMAGTRLNYGLELGDFGLGVMAEYARSGGIDRKATQLGFYDVTTKGNAFGAGLVPQIAAGPALIRLTTRFFYAEGGSYAADGLPFSHGFVSFKGSQVGGLNMNDYAGWHPSAYIGGQGIDDDPNEFDRKAGTMTLHGGLSALLFEQLQAAVDVWHFIDTSSTNLSFGDDEELALLADDLPFGWTFADLEAQERFGRTLGTEINLTLSYDPSEMISFYGVGGVFLPGDYYELPIERAAGDFRGAENPVNFSAAALGAILRY